jgi:hypothetical protein
MTLILPIPDDLMARLGEAGDVARRALEAFALAEYQAGARCHAGDGGELCPLVG